MSHNFLPTLYGQLSVGQALPRVVEVYQNWIISENQNTDTTWYQIF